MVCLLKKSLYGLKQNHPRVWNETFKNFRAQFNIKPTQSDPSVFVGEFMNSVVYLALYVDDGLIMAKHTEAIDKVLEAISTKFEILVSDADVFVGLQIDRDAVTRDIFISKEGYINTLLDRFNMTECNESNVPMLPETDLVPVTEVDTSLPFMQLVGALLFLAKCIRPDIAYAVSKLSQFMNRYDITHWNAAKHVLRYLKKTKKPGITFKSGGKLVITGCCDSNFAGDKNDE